jgi:hypothetical protein
MVVNAIKDTILKQNNVKMLVKMGFNGWAQRENVALHLFLISKIIANTIKDWIKRPMYAKTIVIAQWHGTIEKTMYA